jgi:hypothetical protein
MRVRRTRARARMRAQGRPREGRGWRLAVGGWKALRSRGRRGVQLLHDACAPGAHPRKRRRADEHGGGVGLLRRLQRGARQKQPVFVQPQPVGARKGDDEVVPARGAPGRGWDGERRGAERNTHDAPAPSRRPHTRTHFHSCTADKEYDSYIRLSKAYTVHCHPPVAPLVERDAGGEALGWRVRQQAREPAVGARVRRVVAVAQRGAVARVPREQHTACGEPGRRAAWVALVTAGWGWAVPWLADGGKRAEGGEGRGAARGECAEAHPEWRRTASPLP